MIFFFWKHLCTILPHSIFWIIKGKFLSLICGRCELIFRATLDFNPAERGCASNQWLLWLRFRSGVIYGFSAWVPVRQTSRVPGRIRRLWIPIVKDMWNKLMSNCQQRMKPLTAVVAKSIQAWKFCCCSERIYSIAPRSLLFCCTLAGEKYCGSPNRLSHVMPAWQAGCQKLLESIDKSDSPLNPYMCEYRWCERSRCQMIVEGPSCKPWEELLRNVTFWKKKMNVWIRNVVMLRIKQSLWAEASWLKLTTEIKSFSE